MQTPKTSPFTAVPAQTPVTVAPSAQNSQKVPPAPANGHSGKTLRTPAVARAERAARKAAARPAPVSDKHADALLRQVAPDAEYPALTSRTLSRREAHDAGERDTFGDGGGVQHGSGSCNVNSANFNRAAPPSSLSAAALSDLVAEDVDELLGALDLDADTRQMLLLRMEGCTLQEIADRMGVANRQTVDRRIQSVGMKLFAYWLADDTCGFESVIRAETHKTLVHTLAGGRPAVPATVCACGSHQHRAQRVKGQEGVLTYHCENCTTKRTEGEFRALLNA